MQTAEDSRFFGLSAGFDSFSNAGKELIIQYQAKYEKDIECGGGYVKVGPKLSDPKTFGDPTPYNIMFGPDKCGYTKRTHLIFSYKGKNVLKKSDLAYKQEGEGTSHLQLGVKRGGAAVTRLLIYKAVHVRIHMEFESASPTLAIRRLLQVPADPEAGQHRQGGDRRREDLRGFPEGGLGAPGPQGDQGPRGQEAQ